MMYGYPVAPPPRNGPIIERTGKLQRDATIVKRPTELLLSKQRRCDVRGGGPRVVATVVIGVMILLAIIVMAATVFVLASGSRSNDKITSNDERPDMTEQNMRTGGGMTVIVTEFRVPSSPPPTHDKVDHPGKH
ncbi:hypothetical protein MTO96_043256 [Rhipicephalus appendiculatus]